MKKKTLNLFLVILTFMLSISISACRKKTSITTTSKQNNATSTTVTKEQEDIEPMEYSELQDYTGGVHIFNKTKTSKFLINDKNSDYVILVPDIDNSTVLQAAAELMSLIQESTGANLSIYRESDCPADKKHISLGNTNLSENIKVDEIINSNGYIIKTMNDDIFIKSKGDHGVLWGVYEFLTQTVGYNCVAYDEWSFNQDNQTVPLYDFDIVDSPDFERRIANNGAIYRNEQLANKYRFLLPHTDVYLQGDGVEAYHNFFEYVPKALYEESHPEWFSDDGTQLCLTAHGNKESYDLLVNTVAEKMKKIISLDTQNRSVLTFTQEDRFTWCNCEHCSALYEKYGTDSGSVIMFLNDVSIIVEDWRKEHYPEKEVLYAIFAYMRTVNAPSIKNSDGTFSPIDEDVVCNENLAVIFAPIYQELAYGIDQPENKTLYDNVMAWRAVCENFGYWGYSVYYTHTNLMFNSFTTAQSIYKFLLNELNAAWIFDQGQDFAPTHTAFTYFKMYLQSNWQWDVNRDYRVMKENFFESYYKDAKESMMKLYDEYSTHMYYIYKELKQGTTVYSHVKFNDTTFPFQMLKQWLSYIEDAKEAISIYETENPVLYKKLLDRIELESISVRYIIWKCHQSNYSQADWQMFLEEYERDVNRFGINYDIVDG